jgi:hypothetical protein
MRTTHTDHIDKSYESETNILPNEMCASNHLIQITRLYAYIWSNKKKIFVFDSICLYTVWYSFAENEYKLQIICPIDTSIIFYIISLWHPQDNSVYQIG